MNDSRYRTEDHGTELSSTSRSKVLSMIKNIVVPLDGSDSCFKALDLACDLAEKYQAKLLFPPELVYEKVVAKNVLETGIKQAQEKGLKSVNELIEYGDPAKTIVDVAAKKHADTIIMGTRGLSDIKGLVMGSVAHKVSHIADCTVISVK